MDFRYRVSSVKLNLLPSSVASRAPSPGGRREQRELMSIFDLQLETERLILRPPQAAGFRGVGGFHRRRGSRPAYRRRAAASGGLAQFRGDDRGLAPAGLRHVLGDRESHRPMGRPAGSVAAGRLAGYRGRLEHRPRALGQGFRTGRRHDRDRLGVRSPGLDRSDPHDCRGKRQFQDGRREARLAIPAHGLVAGAARCQAGRNLGPVAGRVDAHAARRRAGHDHRLRHVHFGQLPQAAAAARATRAG